MYGHHLKFLVPGISETIGSVIARSLVQMRSRGSWGRVLYLSWDGPSQDAFDCENCVPKVPFGFTGQQQQAGVKGREQTVHGMSWVNKC